MKTLLLPVAGNSSRYPNTRPKWLLTMPDGKLMFEKSIEMLDLNKFDKVIIICLADHIHKYMSEAALDIICKEIGNNVNYYMLSKKTNSQSETIARCIVDNNLSGSIYIKDCDNQFIDVWSGQNSVAVVDLNNVGLIDAKNKSYIISDSLGYINNIVEKKVISNLFCCGGYGFESATDFLNTYNKINSQKEIYISHIIYAMILEGYNFKMSTASHYVDWGTYTEYINYTKSYLTVFCDVDGVLFENGSKFQSDGWKTAPILENLQAIKKLKKSGLLYLIITSSRPVSEINYIKNVLNMYEIVADQYVMGLPHTKRIIVNDFSITNPYPSAIAINLERNNKNLSNILDTL